METDQATEKDDRTEETSSPPQKTTDGVYKNSLLAAVGYLDLTNTLDFPANVWNDNPLPLFAVVLMGLGGSISILYTIVAVWDMQRSWRNIKVLREERAYLLKRRQESTRLVHLEEAWINVNFRELGWEIVDRMMMDIFMLVAGILVGAGCLMAIRGDIDTVFLASNILSGYLGNSFVASYALINVAWSVYMWNRATVVGKAASTAEREVDSNIATLMRKHARRHKIYSFVNGLSFLISGIGSELSAQLWQGYVVLIPCVFGVIFCNWFWRYCLGYNRRIFADRGITSHFDLEEHVSLTTAIRVALATSTPEQSSFKDLVGSGGHAQKRTAALEFMQHFGLRAEFDNHVDPDSREKERAQKDGHYQDCSESFASIANRNLFSTARGPFRDEERFLLELYGYFLAESEPHLASNELKESHGS